MAKIWIKGYVKPDGTKVKGHYRDVDQIPGSRKEAKTMASRIRMGMTPQKASDLMAKKSFRSSRQGVGELKKFYGQYGAEITKMLTGKNRVI